MNLENSSQNPANIPKSGRMGRLAQLIEQEAGREGIDEADALDKRRALVIFGQDDACP